MLEVLLDMKEYAEKNDLKDSLITLDEAIGKVASDLEKLPASNLIRLPSRRHRCA